MIVDDSVMMCKALARMLQGKPNIEIVAIATGGEQALAQIPTCAPDVITLDVNMPGMDGITTLKRIMVYHPRPVIMLSAVGQEGTASAFDCISCGAIDFINKPSALESLDKKAEDIYDKIVHAADVQVRHRNE